MKACSALADCTTVTLSTGKKWKTEELRQQSGFGPLRTKFARASSVETHRVTLVRGFALEVALATSSCHVLARKRATHRASARAVVQAAGAERRDNQEHHRGDSSPQGVTSATVTVVIVLTAV